MSTLILSCNTGGGHNTCSAAIAEAYERRGLPCHKMDALAFISPRFSRLLSGGHTVLYRRFPSLFRVGYRAADQHPSLLCGGGAGQIFSSGGPALANYIHVGGYDSVICTHVFSAMILSAAMRCRSLPITASFVATDYTCSPGAVQQEIDHYFIPHADLSADFIAAGVPREKLIPSGIPVSAAFTTRLPRAQAKERLGLDSEAPHLLLSCGSMGCGPLEKLTAALVSSLPAHTAITVVCGTNETLRRHLAAAYSQSPRVRILGYTGEMSLLMDSADLYVTKAGGLSTSEAAAKGLPMVLIDAVAGCETYNRDFFCRMGAALSARHVEDLLFACQTVLENEEIRMYMEEALDNWTYAQGAETICRTLLEQTASAAGKGG